MSTQPGASDEQPPAEQGPAPAAVAQPESEPKEEDTFARGGFPAGKTLQAPGSQDLQRLHHQLGFRYKEVAMTRQRQLMIEDCVQELQNIVSALFQNCAIRSFGSIQNGFSTEDSDLDATITQPGVMQMDSQMSAEALQRYVLPALAENKSFEITGNIAAARIPILKLRFWRGEGEALDVDLSCHNTEAFPNTQLLSAYAQMDPIIVALGVLVKLWAKSAGVSGAPQKHLSSYSIILMVLYFLQVEHGMPCLPTWAFTGAREIPPEGRRQWKWNNSMSLLLFEFFKFYALEFKWGTEVVAMHIGQRTANSDERHKDLRGRWTTQLHIADPILTNRNLNAPLGLEQEGQLRRAIWEAACALEQGNLPVGLTPLNPNRTDRQEPAMMPTRTPFAGSMGGGYAVPKVGGFQRPMQNMGMHAPKQPGMMPFSYDRWAYGMPQLKAQSPMMGPGGMGVPWMGMQQDMEQPMGKGGGKMGGGKGPQGPSGLKGAVAKFGMQSTSDGGWPGSGPSRLPAPKSVALGEQGNNLVGITSPGALLAKAKGKAKSEAAAKEKAKAKGEPKALPAPARLSKEDGSAAVAKLSGQNATHHVIWSRKLPPTDGRYIGRPEDRDLHGDPCQEGPPEDEVPMPFLSNITWLV